MRTVEFPPTFEGWQAAARALLREQAAPAEVIWREAPGTTPAGATAPGVARVPRRFVDLARRAAAAPDPARWAALYAVLFRLVTERRDLLDFPADPDVRRLSRLAGAVDPEPLAAPLLEPPADGAAPFVPAGAGLDELRAAGQRCRGCELYRHATQAVFGSGPVAARIVLVGEQPGDQEDRQGRPFVGPAGEVLDRALAEAGIARGDVYVTNAVKHFKFVERGKRRIHQTPRQSEVAACRPWLEAELAIVAPAVLGALGATAARVLLGPDFRLLRQRGQFLPTRWTPRTLATLHPSAVLRGQDDAEQARLYAMLLADLRLIAGAARG